MIRFLIKLPFAHLSRYSFALFIVFFAVLFCSGCESAEEAGQAMGWGTNDCIEESVPNTCDYFNGEVVSVTENGLVLTPVAEWKWSDTAKVRIPQTKLFDGDYSDIKPGDKIRVAFNGNTMEWSGDEVSIRTVFLLFRVSDDATLE